jgi:hypothetical protein
MSDPIFDAARAAGRVPFETYHSYDEEKQKGMVQRRLNAGITDPWVLEAAERLGLKRGDPDTPPACESSSEIAYCNPKHPLYKKSAMENDLGRGWLRKRFCGGESTVRGSHQEGVSYQEQESCMKMNPWWMFISGTLIGGGICLVLHGLGVLP